MTAVTDAQRDLPAADLVGFHTSWELPNGDHVLTILADFIGFASSHRNQHSHAPGKHAAIGARCKACRWFESRIFRELEDPERYLIHFTGATIVPNEHFLTRVEWAYSGEEVVSLLGTRHGDAKSEKCPVCDGSKLVSRPPGVAADQVSFTSATTGPWPCAACDGTGIVHNNAVVFYPPARRVLSQAAGFDEEISLAWQRRTQ